ncbi:MAG: cytidylate kinase family protein [Lachnospiraceae bacterium]|nr:cytidylate kinase family protein [Lachnospiraceae bacterium]
MQRDHISFEKAKQYVKQTERRREAYYNYYTPYEWGNPQFYDLCVNTSHANLDFLADHIASYIRQDLAET